MTREKGFTIIELFIAVAIFAWLVSASVPNFRNYYLTSQADAEARQILRHLQKARELAIYSGNEMTFCGADQNQRCDRHDIRRFIVFFDANRNRQLDTDEKLEAELIPKFDGHIYMGPANSRSIRYSNEGRANPPNSIFLCPRNAPRTLIRRVTTNMAGRPYLARPLSDGVVANWDKSPIDCSTAN